MTDLKKSTSAKKTKYFVPKYNIHVEATSSEEALRIAKSEAKKKASPVKKDI